MHLKKESNKLIITSGASVTVIEPWGRNSLRVRSTKEAVMDPNDWALTEIMEECRPEITFTEIDMTEPWYYGEERKENKKTATEASIKNGKITAKVNCEGWISFYNQKGELLTEEYWRNRNRLDRYAVPMRMEARELKPHTGSTDYELTMRFEAFDGEKIFGMGQYQDKNMDKKGSVLELAQRNSQSSVPFYISNRGYGFFWNNPAVGSAVFGVNKTEWNARSTKKLDYLVIAGDTPAEIEEQYTLATGRSPMMPEYAMGFWQSKLRYRSQDELMKMVREHKRRGLPMDVVIADFFHWTRQGDFQFEPRDWPDPEGMVKELKEYGIELAVSVWPTIDEKSVNFGKMSENGYLVRTDRASGFHMNWMGNTIFYDATHPGARKFVWERCKENYYNKGIRMYWLDEAEPEFGTFDFDVYRYHIGPAMQCTNIYPVMFARGFYEGLKEAGEARVISLTRCSWAGSQKYGVLSWSGDVHSSFRSMREQLQAGLNMAIAGIPWWTSDIGGFLGGDIKNPSFCELLVRWFQWGAFNPVFRLHGERMPFYKKEREFIDDVRQMSSGQDNEVWSFGDDNYEILKEFLFIRERLRPYVRQIMRETHEKGSPVMRPLFYEFPDDEKAWEVYDSYMFGPDLLVAPILEEGARERTLYLPEGGTWKDAYTKQAYEGGQQVTVPAPMAVIPVFMRDGVEYEIYR